jgi:hypothetical protein
MIGFTGLLKQAARRLSYPSKAYYSWKQAPSALLQGHKLAVRRMSSKLYIEDTPAEVKNAKVFNYTAKFKNDTTDALV